jgi:hypothetical protein
VGERLFQEAVRRLGREPESLEELQWALDAVMADYNRAPQAELGGLSPVQVQRLLARDWTAPEGALRLNDRLTPDELAGVRLLANARVFLRALEESGGTRVTAAGNLNRKFVAAMLDAMSWPPGFLDDLHRYNKVVNEQDAWPLHLLRVLVLLAGLIRKRKGAFVITRRGARLCDESRAGELYALLFRTQFQKMNLAYLDLAPEAPGFQDTIAYTLYRFGRVGDRWLTPERLAPEVVLPAVLDEIPALDYIDAPGLIVQARLLRPLKRFGLAESREVPGAHPRFPGHEYRKTPLYDRFLQFDLSDR